MILSHSLQILEASAVARRNSGVKNEFEKSPHVSDFNAGQLCTNATARGRHRPFLDKHQGPGAICDHHPVASTAISTRGSGRIQALMQCRWDALCQFATSPPGATCVYAQLGLVSLESFSRG